MRGFPCCCATPSGLALLMNAAASVFNFIFSISKLFLLPAHPQQSFSRLNFFSFSSSAPKFSFSNFDSSILKVTGYPLCAFCPWPPGRSRAAAMHESSNFSTQPLLDFSFFKLSAPSLFSFFRFHPDFSGPFKKMTLMGVRQCPLLLLPPRPFFLSLF